MDSSFRFFPLWKRGMKGDFMAFQKTKLLKKTNQGGSCKTLKSKESRHSGQAKRDPESRISRRFWIPAPAPDPIGVSPEE
jgi:hypothetical protein